MHMSTVALATLAVVAFVPGALGTLKSDWLESLVYSDVVVADACVLLLTNDGQVGCTSAQREQVGAVYLMQTAEERRLFAQAPHPPYTVTIPFEFFNATVVDELIATNKLAGIALLPATYSDSNSAAKCPNQDSSIYSGPCHEWNSFGNGLQDRFFDFPIYLLNDTSADEVIQCGQRNAPTSGANFPDYPLCAVGMNSWMWGSQNAEVCLRRGTNYCQAMGGQSVLGSMRALSDGDELLVAASAIDATALFHKLAFGANNEASAFVAMIAAADALKRNGTARSLPKNIMFSLLHGQQYGLMGSAALTYDMSQGTFPGGGSVITLNDVAGWFEFGQIGLRGDVSAPSPLVMHQDTQTATGQAAFNAIVSQAATEAGVTLQGATGSAGVPPAGLQSLLKLNRTGIPGVVVADHDQTFNNVYYRSVLDTGNNVEANNTLAVTNLCNAATMAAKALYMLAAGTAGTQAGSLEANCTLIGYLYECFTFDINCAYLKRYGNREYPSSATSRYISVYSGNNIPVSVSLIQQALHEAVATPVEGVTTKEACTAINSSVTWVNGQCVLGFTYFTPALSPSLSSSFLSILNDDYPVWTESTWQSDPTMRMFDIDSDAIQLGDFFAGLIVAIASFPLTYFATAFLAKKAY